MTTGTSETQLVKCPTCGLAMRLSRLALHAARMHNGWQPRTEG